MFLLISVSPNLCSYTVTQIQCVFQCTITSHHIASVDAAAVASLRHIAEATEHRLTLYIYLFVLARLKTVNISVHSYDVYKSCVRKKHD